VSPKTTKRILYGVAALVLLLVAGREFLATGFSSEVVMPGSLGVILGFLAATGAG